MLHRNICTSTTDNDQKGDVSIHPLVLPDRPPSNALEHFSFTSFVEEQRKTLHSRRMMPAVSFLIEDYAAQSAGTHLIAAFRRFSHYRRRIHRYRHIAPRLGLAFVLGFPDEPPPELPNVTQVAPEAE